ncbi:MAG: HAD hydrolase family protein [bacterium]|nr:HAD hydrolase family protein [bacterium]
MNFKERLNAISTIMFDVDGVLTDGKVLVMESGEMVRNMYSKDGYALNQAIKKGYRVVIISGGNNQAIKNALIRNGVTDVFIQQHDKMQCYLDYLSLHDLKDEEVLFMGDDLPDHDIMNRVGVAACPNNSATEIKAISHYISPNRGGEGCVRDIIEQVMRLQGKWAIEKW